MTDPKITVITVVYNAAATVKQCVESVLSQDYPNVEYIVIDGKSKDNTMQILEAYRPRLAKLVSEPDKGLYDAMNKGLALATGDIVGILNADDFYASAGVLSHVAAQFKAHSIDALSTDVAIYRGEQFEKPFRYYSAKSFRTWQFRLGMQPPHPGFFVKKWYYDKFGGYESSYRISADFDMLLRFIKIHKAPTFYDSFLSVKMRDGGLSANGFKSKLLMNREDLHSLRKHGIFSFGLLIWMKYLLKLRQLM